MFDQKAEVFSEGCHFSGSACAAQALLSKKGEVIRNICPFHMYWACNSDGSAMEEGNELVDVCLIGLDGGTASVFAGEGSEKCC